MTESVNLEILSSRSGFNSAVRHIQKTMDIAGDAGSSNLGDIIYEMDDEELTGPRINLLLRMMLVDKFGYKTASANLSSVIDDPAGLSKEFSKWNGIDLVAAYYHPELGILVANPKVAQELALFGQLKKRELLVIYAGFQGKETDEKCQKAADIAIRLFEGSKASPPAELLKGKYTVKKVSKPNSQEDETPVKEAKTKTAAKAGAPARNATVKNAPEPAKKAVTYAVKPPAAPAKMTPRYAVVVQNELFHNGNVEAWKKIIASYNAKHPDLVVYIYYEGERILDINSLFNWGKVKHGTAIDFAVAGDQIQDVAKLQRYLAQGASKMFEAFLKGPVNSVLKLF